MRQNLSNSNTIFNFMNLKTQLMRRFPTLQEEDFATHECDLYVVAYPYVKDWLIHNYRFWDNVSTFYSPADTNWKGAGKLCFDIPFADW